MATNTKKPLKSIAHAVAAARPPVRTATLRGPTTYSDKSIKVDKEKGIIYNVSLLSVGATKGHPFTIDDVTVEQLVSLASTKPDGVKSRFRHPEITETPGPDGNPIQEIGDDTGSMVGRIRNVRIEGPQARGDIYLGGYAAVMPGLGNVREYLLLHADEDPTGIGMSAMFSYTAEPTFGEDGSVQLGPARLESLDAIDFVGQPAANPAGLLSAKAATFDPRPPSGSPNTPGWQDPKPTDPPPGPIPAGTPDMPNNVYGQYLSAIAKEGPLHLGGLAARFTGRLEAMRAGADWLVSHGYAEKTNAGTYKVTPKGRTLAMTNFKSR